MTRYYLSATALAGEDGEPVEVSVEADEAGVIRYADPLVRRFLGQTVQDLMAWLAKYGPVPVRMENAAPRLFE